jgi:3-phenylpropionate/cinnamic acid dioxygenase small subunit
MEALAHRADAVGAMNETEKTMATTTQGERFRSGSPEYSAALDFFTDEVAALDSQRFNDWLAMLAPEIEYRMPVRIERMPKDGMGFDDHMEYFSENLSSLTTRVKRFDTDQAWSEQPISRTRHLVTNARVMRTDDPAVISAVTNFLVARTHWDFDYDFFTGERHDLLRRTEGGLLLARRVIYLDQTLLKSYNLSIFF